MIVSKLWVSGLRHLRPRCSLLSFHSSDISAGQQFEAMINIFYFRRRNTLKPEDVLNVACVSNISGFLFATVVQILEELSVFI